MASPVTTPPAHTAGPWLQDVCLSQLSQLDKDPVWAAVITTREDENGSCLKVACAYGETKTDCEGNARLIAAAPELLEACYAALGELESGHVETEDDTTVRQLRAALDKAEGRQPAQAGVST